MEIEFEICQQNEISLKKDDDVIMIIREDGSCLQSDVGKWV